MASFYANLCKRPVHGLLLVFLINVLCHFVLGDLFKYQLYHKTQRNKAKVVHSRSRRDPYTITEQTQEGNNLLGKPGQGYYIEVQIGTPPQKLNVLIDTGSSNFAVACEDHPDITTYFHRDRSSTYKNLGIHVNVPYTQGSWDGILGQDYVSVTSLLSVRVQANIACITKTDEFYINGSNWQGILGLGYAGIARPDDTVEPFFDSLTSSGEVENFFSLELCGTAYQSRDPEHEMGGSLIFGQSNLPVTQQAALYSTPIHKEWYYEVVITDIAVNGSSLNMDCKEYNFGKTIVDSGTTNLRLPNRVFKNLVDRVKNNLKLPGEEVPKAGFWSGDEMLCWSKGRVPYNGFPTVSLTLPVNDSAAFKLILSPQQYLRAVGEENNEPLKDCFKFAIADSDSGSVIGAVVMEGYYIVFNRENKTIQFAESRCGVLNNTAVISSIEWDKKYTGNYNDCAYVKIETMNDTLIIVGYVMAGVVVICLLPLVIMIGKWQCKRCKCRRSSLKRTGSDSNGLVDDS